MKKTIQIPCSIRIDGNELAACTQNEDITPF